MACEARLARSAKVERRRVKRLGKQMPLTEETLSVHSQRPFTFTEIIRRGHSQRVLAEAIQRGHSIWPFTLAEKCKPHLIQSAEVERRRVKLVGEGGKREAVLEADGGGDGGGGGGGGGGG